MTQKRWIIFVFAAVLALSAGARAAAPQDLSHVRNGFASPPDDCRIMMRWWWFGPAVTKAELRHELEQMKAAGIGGVELATLYPQRLDDAKTGFHNQLYLSDEHLDAIRYAAEQAQALGLRFDLSLGSGWPFGGPHIPVTEAAGQLRASRVAIAPGAKSVAVPYIGTGETLLAVSFVSGNRHTTLAVAPPAITEGRMSLAGAPAGAMAALFLVASRTGMMVKRPAVGAEGFVLDPYNATAIQAHLTKVDNRLMQAFSAQPPYAVFSDSLEVNGSDWTDDMLAQFRARRGYDLTAHLSQLFEDTGPEDAAIRHDWGETLTELANDNFLSPMHRWAQQHRTLLRSQTYGIPPVTLWSNRFVDLPEGEGKATTEMWRQFSDLRWASSAAHLLHRPVASSETWTWLHSPAFAATPLDMKRRPISIFWMGSTNWWATAGLTRHPTSRSQAGACMPPAPSMRTIRGSLRCRR